MVKRNCSTPESFEKRSIEYQNYLINRGYNPNQVRQQFDKVRSIPRKDLLAPTTKESNKLFPLVLDYNPNLPNIGKILHSCKHLIYDSPSLAKIFPKGSIIPSFRRPKNIYSRAKVPREMEKKFEIAGFRNNRGSVKFVTVNHLLIKYSTL